MNWLTFQLSATRRYIAHFFKRPDIARLDVLDGELYRLRLRNAERSVALKAAEKRVAEQEQEIAALKARLAQFEALLGDTISERLDESCYVRHVAGA